MATSRDGLVGYDAALTQLRSGVRFPLFVACSFLTFAPSDVPLLLLLVAVKDLCGSAVPAEVCRGPINFVCELMEDGQLLKRNCFFLKNREKCMEPPLPINLPRST